MAISRVLRGEFVPQTRRDLLFKAIWERELKPFLGAVVVLAIGWIFFTLMALAFD